jgi:hypothetical protein
MERIYISLFILLFIIFIIFFIFRYLREIEEKKKEKMEIEKFENYVECQLNQKKIYKMNDEDIFDIFIT